MIYKCDNCGAVFEEPDVMVEDPSPAGVGLAPGKYKYYVCPACGSEDIDECPYEEDEEDE